MLITISERLAQHKVLSASLSSKSVNASWPSCILPPCVAVLVQQLLPGTAIYMVIERRPFNRLEDAVVLFLVCLHILNNLVYERS